MYPSDILDDVLFFDLGTTHNAMRLCEYLWSERTAWIHDRDEVRLVAVVLRTEPEDLATLLRAVESWAADHGVARLRFELDGRVYRMRTSASRLSPAGVSAS